jgi:hypothetical protein
MMDCKCYATAGLEGTFDVVQCDLCKTAPSLLVEADSHFSAILHRYGRRPIPNDFMNDIRVTLEKIQKITRARS